MIAGHDFETASLEPRAGSTNEYDERSVLCRVCEKGLQSSVEEAVVSSHESEDGVLWVFAAQEAFERAAGASKIAIK